MDKYQFYFEASQEYKRAEEARRQAKYNLEDAERELKVARLALMDAEILAASEDPKPTE